MAQIKFGKQLLGGTTDVLAEGRLIGRAHERGGRWYFTPGNPPGLVASPTLTADSADELLVLVESSAKGGLPR